MHEYRITGTRFLRRYTAPAMTPSTAAGSDAAAIAARLCDVEWRRSDERYPTFPVYGKPDENVDARESFDAAEWCAGHDEAKRHRVYANACIYRYEIPEGVRGRSCAKVRVKVTCDPYTPQGARVSVATTSSDDLPTSCQDCRAGDVHAEGVSPRTAVVENGSTYWYETTTTAELDYGRELGKYLVVFIGLEDYRARNGWLEGAARIDAVSLVFDDEVDGFTEDGENDLGDGVSAARELQLCSGGVLPYVAEGDRYVRSYECLASGGDLPPAKMYVKQVSADTSALYFGETKIRDIEGDGRGIRIFSSPICFKNGRAFSGYTSGNGIIAKQTVYDCMFFAVLGVDDTPDVDTGSANEFVNEIAPGVTFWVAYRIVSGTDTKYRIDQLYKVHNFLDNISKTNNGVVSDSGSISASDYEAVENTYAAYLDGPAHRMLAERTAEQIMLVPGCGSMSTKNRYHLYQDDLISVFTDHNEDVSIGVACAVYVVGQLGIARLGAFNAAEIVSSSTSPSVLSYNLGLKGEFIPDAGSAPIFGSNALFALWTSESLMFSRRFFSYWVETKFIKDDKQTVIGERRYYWFRLDFGDVKASSVTCIPVFVDGDTLQVGSVGGVKFTGTVHGVVRYNPSPTSSFLVYGDFSEVDGRPCSFAFVCTVRSNGVYVWIPSVEAMAKPDTFDQLCVTSVRHDAETVDKKFILMTGAFKTIGGRSLGGGVRVANIRTTTKTYVKYSYFGSVPSGLTGSNFVLTKDTYTDTIEIPADGTKEDGTSTISDTQSNKDTIGYNYDKYGSVKSTYTSRVTTRVVVTESRTTTDLVIGDASSGILFSLDDGSICPAVVGGGMAQSPHKNIVASWTDTNAITSHSLDVRGVNVRAAPSGDEMQTVSIWATGNHIRTFRARDREVLSSCLTGESGSCVGLRNVYFKFLSGLCEHVNTGDPKHPGAAFVLRRSEVGVPTTKDGIEESVTTVSMWRILVTAALIPFSVPTGFRPRGIKFTWADLTATSGTRLHAWIKTGEYLSKYPEDDLRLPELYSAGTDNVSGWKRIATFDASETGDETVSISELLAGEAVGTILLTAYLPGNINPDADMPDHLGVGSVDADSVNESVSGLDTGWRPDISLIG